MLLTQTHAHARVSFLKTLINRTSVEIIFGGYKAIPSRASFTRLEVIWGSALLS
jgi:hypothetical protein